MKRPDSARPAAKPGEERPTPIPQRSLVWRGYQLRHRLHLEVWFPHLPLSVALAVVGIFVLGVGLGTHLSQLTQDFPNHLLQLHPASMLFLIIGAALILMSVGLALRSRLAWTVALLLTVAAILSLALVPHAAAYPLLIYYSSLVLLVLIAAYRSFSRSSLAAGTIFALSSSLLLLIYAVFGTLYLGDQFAPPIHDAVTALYFAIVTMGTVGYGDISAQTPHARLFTISIIILGIAVFATSITAIVGPLVTGSLNRIVNRKEGRMHRSNHYVVVGVTPLAMNTFRELKRRHHPVVLIALQAPAEADVDPAEVIVGDASDLQTLRKANAEQALAVLALRADDSENAFIALAVKELKGKAKTVVSINDSKHVERVKLVQPDIIISPQVLGGEILAMALSGENVTGEFVLDRLLNFKPPAAG